MAAYTGTRYNRFSIPTFLESTPPGSFNIAPKEIVIEIPEGDYLLDYSLMFLDHDVVIKGAGMGKTVLLIDESDDFLHFTDDAVLNFQGADSQTHGFIPINVRIENLTIQTNISKEEAETPAAGSNLTTRETYLIKCYNVESLIMRNVEIRTSNLSTTCLDIRRGKNINISGCVFANFNRRWKGGCVWLRGDMENVNIVDNDFYKYGNDEVIGIWGANSYSGSNEADFISKKNINIRYNRIYCQDTNGGPNSDAIINDVVDGRNGMWNGSNQRFIVLFTNQDDNVIQVSENVFEQRDTPCLYTLNGIHITNNELYINAPIDYLFTMALDKHTTYKEISINNNIIKYGNWRMSGDLVDFCIEYDTPYDFSQIEGGYNLSSDEAFDISGNTIECGSNRFYVKEPDGDEYDVDSHRCLEFSGVVVHFNKNLIKYTRCRYTPDEANYPNKGLELFYTRLKGGTVIFNENHCEGLKNLMITNQQSTAIPIINLVGRSNYLCGNPRIDYVNVDESHVSLIGNELVCEYQLFLVCEFADSGTVIFEGNRVHRDMSRVPTYTVPLGQIFYTGKTNGDNDIPSMQFICCGNIFDNLHYSSLMYNDFLKLSTIRAIHENNIFVDTVE